MLNTAGLFEVTPLQGNIAGVSAEIPDLFGSKFVSEALVEDRLNRLTQIAIGNTNVLFDTSYGLTQTSDLVADATGSAIDLFDQGKRISKAIDSEVLEMGGVEEEQQPVQSGDRYHP